MARAKNEPAEGTVQVNIADFQRTRDSVIVALATLQSSVQDLSRAYINHANTVLGPGANASQLSLGLTNTLLDTGLVGQQVVAAGVPEVESGETKKKRKRAPHDPNAPKRALTPYFLYMQSARSQIASELGDNAKPKEVADEGTRRWAAMAEEDKSVWNTLYARNLAIYREKMRAYKNGLPVPDDAAAAKLVDSGAVPLPAVDDAAGEDDDEDSDEPEPVKVPEPPKGGKRRKTGDKPATPAKDAAAATPAKKSPEKKKSEKKAAPAAAAAPKPVAPAAAAADAGKKKKAAKK